MTLFAQKHLLYKQFYHLPVYGEVVARPLFQMEVWVMTADKASAEMAFERFLAGESVFCLVEGTAQLGKLGMIMQGLMRKHPSIGGLLASLVDVPVLFRTVTFDAAEKELARALPTPAYRATMGRDRKLKAAGLTLHVDTFDARTWLSTPRRVNYAVVYLPERLSPAKAEACLTDIMGRQPSKVIFCTLTDIRTNDLGWVHALAPFRITYHLADENPAGHAEAMTWSKPEDYFVSNT